MGISRRDLLLSAGLAAFFGGCRTFEPICPNELALQRPASSFTVDVHAHIFNATDLQVKQFIHRIAAAGTSEPISRLAGVLGSLVQAISWTLAPDAGDELRRLTALSSELAKCHTVDADALTRQFDKRLAEWRQEKYSVARDELQRKERAFRSSASTSSLSQIRRESSEVIVDLPESYQRFEELVESDDSSELAIRRVTINSALKFVVEMFQYRYVSLRFYLVKFATPDRAMDLVLPALVDYDWWLAKGSATQSSLRSQAALMSKIAVATQGRSHAWIPFCPFRELVFRQNARATFSSLEFVKKAVLQDGAIGVKIYPPMGFAAYGNADLGDFWHNADWLTGHARTREFGAQLDDALSDLYSWCVEREVPILAHSNLSNGPTKEFAELAGPKYWDIALTRFPKLRVNFGHFGGANERETPATVEGILHLLQANPGSNHRYADGSYFEGVIDYPDMLRENLRSLLEHTNDPTGLLTRRFLFGTDWKMLAIERGNNRYLERYELLMRAIEAEMQSNDFSRRFFGGSAAEFLGLRKGERGRERLEQFYSRNGVRAPGWMEKVDAIT